MSKHNKKTAQLVLFLLGQMRQMFIFIFMLHILEMKLNTFVTKYADILIFNFLYLSFILSGA